MIIDVTGTILIPGYGGEDCPGNGEHYDENGELIEHCWEECSLYVLLSGAQYGRMRRM